MIRRLALLAFAAVLLAADLSAQESGLADASSVRAPRFLLAATPKPVALDVSRTAVLRRRLTLSLANATVRDALAAVSRQAGLQLTYTEDVIPRGARVRLQATEITVAAALTEILLDAGVDVVFSAATRAALVRRPAGAAPPQTGTIVGRVTDAKTGDHLSGAEIWIEGTKRRTTTGENGFYKFTDVETGAYTLTLRRVGYAKQSVAVTVAADREVTADVALQPVVTQLNELVTTVTGEQRIRELGHVVGRINADSVTREAPVSSLSELLTARVSGFQVFQNQGTVGGKVTLQSRGPNSILLNAEPIVIVDGVRYTSAYVRRAYPFGNGIAGVEPTSPLNDLNPNDIETIEVVKGPSAATLYGTDAANGVVVVTTKRGRPGPTQWQAYGKVLRAGVPKQHYMESYYPWGHLPGDPAPMRCSLGSVAAAYCVQDSVVPVPNPLNDPDWTMLTSHPAWNYGASASGGRQDLRYFFAGDASDAAGPVRIPEALTQPLLQQRGTSELRDEEKKPNTTSQLSLRANVAADLGRSADVRVNSGYVRGATRSLNVSYNPYNNSVLSSSPTVPYGTNGFNPVNVFTTTSTERTDRFTGSANTQLRPASWLTTRATIGLDLATRNRYSLTPNGEGIGGNTNGSVADDRLRQLSLTGDFGATVMARRGRVTLRSSAGAQYVRSVSDQLRSFGNNLPPGGTSVGEASSISASQFYTETVTLGSYIEETVGLNDRLFLTGAVRIDGASAFGQNYDAATYPKMSLSWIVSEEPFVPRIPGLDELRLRYAYGASGQQARPAWAHVSYTVTRGTVDGSTRSMVGTTGLGNPDLRPERVSEHEFGFDLSALAQRVRLGLTWYKRRTADQITTRDLGPGLGTIYTNVGLTTQHGFEAELTAAVLDTRRMSVDVILHHGLHRTKLVKLGGGYPFRYYFGGWVEGYPLGARFERPVTGYDDANNDGIIVADEVRYGPGASYLGESTPPVAQSLTTVVGLFNRRVRLSALFERRTGFIQIDALETSRCFGGQCRALADKSVPLIEQAYARAAYDGYHHDAQPGDFTRFREVAVALDLPASVARALRVRSATVNVAGRNIALWTKFGGPDPESAAVGAAPPGDWEGTPVSGGEAGGIPQTRSWTVRVDLGF